MRFVLTRRSEDRRAVALVRRLFEVAAYELLSQMTSSPGVRRPGQRAPAAPAAVVMRAAPVRVCERRAMSTDPPHSTGVESSSTDVVKIARAVVRELRLQRQLREQCESRPRAALRSTLATSCSAYGLGEHVGWDACVPLAARLRGLSPVSVLWLEAFSSGARGGAPRVGASRARASTASGRVWAL
jgi:hypothetical protein